MKYENAPGYPEYQEYDTNGQLKNYGFFGYPCMMLDAAIGRDDPEGFAFYYDRYFTPDSSTLGCNSVIHLVARRGASNIVEFLVGRGARDSFYSTEKLREIAKLERLSRLPKAA
jgi:hypothetical protein